MIVIKEDKSYLSEVDLMCIGKGIAKQSIHSIRFSEYRTDEQKRESTRLSETMTREQWNASCERHRQEVAEKIERLMDVISANFMVYQYKDKSIKYSTDNWDFFFWCNHGDMSYVTLNQNEKKRTVEQQVTDIHILALLKMIDCEGIQVHIQYTTVYDKQRVTELAASYCESVQGKFIEYNGMLGKVKAIGIGYDGLNRRYAFFKKGASKSYYRISDDYILRQVLA